MEPSFIALLDSHGPWAVVLATGWLLARRSGEKAGQLADAMARLLVAVAELLSAVTEEKRRRDG